MDGRRNRSCRLAPWAFAAAAAALLLSPPSVALANEGRYEALAANPLVGDLVDISEFPGLLTTYGDTVFLSVSENATTGDVGAVIGRQVAFGLWIHRTPRWDDLAELDASFDSFVLPETHHLVDLLFGMDNGFGLRLSLSAGLDNDTAAGPDDDSLSSGGTTVGLDVQAGYSVDRDDYHGDVAAGLTFNYFEVVQEGATTYSTGWIPSFVLHHRSIINPRERLGWAIDVELTRRAYSATAHGEPNVEGALDRWVAAVVVGPRVMLPGDLTLWAGARLDLARVGGEVDGQEQPSILSLGPGLVASAELWLWELLAIRAGVSYDFFWSRSHQPGTELSSSETFDDLGQRFRWSAGLGIAHEGFRLDGTLSHQLIFGGPDSVGGGAPGLMGTVAASYAW